jgi:hypothetical protein
MEVAELGWFVPELFNEKKEFRREVPPFSKGEFSPKIFFFRFRLGIVRLVYIRCLIMPTEQF